MKKKLVLVIFISLFSCKKHDSDRNFKEVKDISKYSQTDFVVALEQEIPLSKNVIYASSLLYAWNYLDSKHSISIIDNNVDELNLLNSSNSFKNSLNKDEVNYETNYDNNEISIKAFFNKSLPFTHKLERFPEPLLFNKTKVENFGFYGSDSEMSSIAAILYFKNDDEFILKLNTKDLVHEIIIIKTQNQSLKKLKDYISEINTKSEIGIEESKNENTNWKYNFLYEDVLKIPIVNFNIEKEYKNLVGSKLLVENENAEIANVFQRTAFILDEKGAEIESEGLTTTTTSEEAIMDEESKPKPKNFILDKPFVILLKRKDSKNPYFVCLINNTELMTRK
ncbi:MAG: serpin family protein [Bacteroidota bacterium]